MFPTRNDIPEPARKNLVQLLNERLAEAIDLSLQAKHAHWNVKGPSFYQLHLLFDKIHEGAREFADLMAERATALGGIAEGALEVVNKRSRLPRYPLHISDGKQHVEALADSLGAFGKNVRQAIEQAEELRDKGTADLFTEVSRAADQFLYFLEAHVQAGW